MINSATELAEWDSFVAAKSWRGGAALHVDTGMRRLGVSPEEAMRRLREAYRERGQTLDLGGAPIELYASVEISPVDPEGTVQTALYNVKATGHVAKLMRDLPAA